MKTISSKMVVMAMVVGLSGSSWASSQDGCNWKKWCEGSGVGFSGKYIEAGKSCLVQPAQLYMSKEWTKIYMPNQISELHKTCPFPTE